MVVHLHTLVVDLHHIVLLQVLCQYFLLALHRWYYKIYNYKNCKNSLHDHLIHHSFHPYFLYTDLKKENFHLQLMIYQSIDTYPKEKYCFHLIFVNFVLFVLLLVVVLPFLPNNLLTIDLIHI